MGCRQSMPTFPVGGKQRKAPPPGVATLEERMRNALQEIIVYKMDHPQDATASFNRIILKFPSIRQAFSSIRTVFKRFDVDGNGTIDSSELGNAMKALGAQLTPVAVEQMFGYAKMTEEGALTFKEFLICLCIGSVLQLFPLLKAYSQVDLKKLMRGSGVDDDGTASMASSGSAASASHQGSSGGPHKLNSSTRSDTGDSEASDNSSGKHHHQQQPSAPVSPLVDPLLEGSALYESGRRLVRALRLVLEAYVLFDTDASGTIDREEVLAIIDEENRKAMAREHGGGGHPSSSLSSSTAAGSALSPLRERSASSGTAMSPRSLKHGILASAAAAPSSRGDATATTARTASNGSSALLTPDVPAVKAPALGVASGATGSASCDSRVQHTADDRILAAGGATAAVAAGAAAGAGPRSLTPTASGGIPVTSAAAAAASAGTSSQPQHGHTTSGGSASVAFSEKPASVFSRMLSGGRNAMRTQSGGGGGSFRDLTSGGAAAAGGSSGARPPSSSSSSSHMGLLGGIGKGARKRAGGSAGSGRGSHGPSNALLSRERWMELDWDGDGQTTFREFLLAFMTWVGVDDDDEDEDGDTELCALPAAMQTAAGVGMVSAADAAAGRASTAEHATTVTAGAATTAAGAAAGLCSTATGGSFSTIVGLLPGGERSSTHSAADAASVASLTMTGAAAVITPAQQLPSAGMMSAVDAAAIALPGSSSGSASASGTSSAEERVQSIGRAASLHSRNGTGSQHRLIAASTAAAVDPLTAPSDDGLDLLPVVLPPPPVLEAAEEPFPQQQMTTKRASPHSRDDAAAAADGDTQTAAAATATAGLLLPIPRRLSREGVSMMAAAAAAGAVAATTPRPLLSSKSDRALVGASEHLSGPQPSPNGAVSDGPQRQSSSGSLRNVLLPTSLSKGAASLRNLFTGGRAGGGGTTAGTPGPAGIGGGGGAHSPNRHNMSTNRLIAPAHFHPDGTPVSILKKKSVPLLPLGSAAAAAADVSSGGSSAAAAAAASGLSDSGASMVSASSGGAFAATGIDHPSTLHECKEEDEAGGKTTTSAAAASRTSHDHSFSVPPTPVTLLPDEDTIARSSSATATSGGVTSADCGSAPLASPGGSSVCTDDNDVRPHRDSVASDLDGPVEAFPQSREEDGSNAGPAAALEKEEQTEGAEPSTGDGALGFTPADQDSASLTAAKVPLPPSPPVKHAETNNSSGGADKLTTPVATTTSRASASASKLLVGELSVNGEPLMAPLTPDNGASGSSEAVDMPPLQVPTEALADAVVGGVRLVAV